MSFISMEQLPGGAQEPWPALPPTVRNRLRVLRAERKWTQAELAARIGVSRQTINSIENEKYDPSLPLAFRMAALFDLRIEEIFSLEEGDPPTQGRSLSRGPG